MPTPKAGEKESDFISRCIPFIKKEKPDLDHDAVVARCYGIWKSRHNHKHLFTLDSYDDHALLWYDLGSDEVNLDDSLEKESFPAVCLVGDRIYKGNFLSAKEIEKAYLSMDGAYHDINHWGTSYPSGFGSQPNIEYIVGYQEGTTYDNASKMMKTNIHIVDTAPKAQVWRGFMDICKQAHRVPNVSVTFWADRKEISVRDLPEGLDYKSYGLTEDDTITSLVDLEFHALASVFQGACDDKAGCGIGIKYDSNTTTVSYDTLPEPFYGSILNVWSDSSTGGTVTIDNTFNDEVYILKKKILKEKIKKEELSNGR